MFGLLLFGVLPRQHAKYYAGLIALILLLLLGGTLYGYLSTPRDHPIGVLQTGRLTDLRASLSAEELARVALLDEADPHPTLSDKEALLVDAGYLLQTNGQAAEFVRQCIASGIPSVVMGDGYQQLRLGMTGLPHCQAQYLERPVIPARIAATGVLMQPSQTPGEDPVCRLLQVEGDSFHPGLVTHVLELFARMRQATPRHDSDLALTGCAIYSTADAWANYGGLIITRRYYRLPAVDPELKEGQSVLEVEIENLPGDSLWGSRWRSDCTRFEVDVNAHEEWHLVDYGRHTLVGNAAASAPADESNGLTTHDYTDRDQQCVIMQREFDLDCESSSSPCTHSVHILYSTSADQQSSSHVAQRYQAYYAKTSWCWHISAHTSRLELTDFNL